MTDFNVTEAMDLLHDYANQLNILHDEIGSIYDAYDFVPNSMSLKIDNDTRELNDLVNPVADNLKAYFLSSRHGGARQGAGRPKKPTKQIRVPEQMVEDIKALCSVYPTHNPDCDDESDMTPKDHLSIEVLRVLDALKCYVESNIDSQSFEPFKY
ncbi:hypothetical protein [Vibrio campbellii]